jgi:hypothetical protein
VLVAASTDTSVALLSSVVASTGLDSLMPRRLAFRRALTVSASASGPFVDELEGRVVVAIAALAVVLVVSADSAVVLPSSAVASTRLDSLMPRRLAFRGALLDYRSVLISSAIARPGGAGMDALVALVA